MHADKKRETHIDSDVVVVGAGIVGASCAFHLAERGLKVRVVEAFAGPAEGSSGKSFASVRSQWHDPLNIELSWRSIQTYRSFEATHGFEVGYRPTGYLFLVPEAAWESQLAAVDLQRAHGVPVSVLSLAEAQELTPFDPHGLAGATWGTADGAVDPHAVTQAYLALAVRRGASIHYRQPTLAFEQVSGGWQVTTKDLQISTPVVVNATGGWGREVAKLAGVDVPVDHVRRIVYSSAPLSGRPKRPMTVDVETGFFLRSEGDRILFGLARSDEPLGYSLGVDWEWLEVALTHGSERFPWLAEMPLDQSGCWAGTYEVTADHRPVLGRNPAAPGWVDACGFSGHGVMQAPEAGRLIAEEVVDGTMHSLDADVLRIDRFSAPSAVSHDFIF